MNLLKHLFHYSFKWQAKYFFTVVVLTIFCLVFLKYRPELIIEIGMLFFYMLLVYSILSCTSIYGGLGASQNEFGRSFSGKYLLSLPVAKKDLLVNLIIANSFSIIPLLLVIFTIAHYNSSGLFSSINSGKVLLNYLSEHTWAVAVSFVFFYVALLSAQVRMGVEEPRKMYNKATIYNYLFIAKAVFLLFFYYIIIFLTVILQNEYFALPIVFALIAYWEFYKTWRSLTNEKFSYWVWKRELITCALLVSFIAGFFGIIVYLKNTAYRYKDNSWPYLYSQGDSTFTRFFEADDHVIQNYLDSNKPLDIYNPDGVGLIHIFAKTDISKYRGGEESFLKNPKLLLLPIRTKKGDCKDDFYCDGFTPLHMLASKGNLKLLEKALRLVPEGVEVLTVNGESPLHYASKFCEYKTLRALIDSGADANLVSKNGFTPLMNAALNNCYAGSILLIKAGADKKTKNKENKTASEIAKDNRHNELSYVIDLID